MWGLEQQLTEVRVGASAAEEQAIGGPARARIEQGGQERARREAASELQAGELEQQGRGAARSNAQEQTPPISRARGMKRKSASDSVAGASLVDALLQIGLTRADARATDQDAAAPRAG